WWGCRSPASPIAGASGRTTRSAKQFQAVGAFWKKIVAPVDSDPGRSSCCYEAEVGEIGAQPQPTSTRRTTMRFMVIVKADNKSEAGILPDTKLLEAMGKYNEELVKAG